MATKEKETKVKEKVGEKWEKTTTQSRVKGRESTKRDEKKRQS